MYLLEVLESAKKYEKENEEMINSLVQKLKLINSFGTYIKNQDICLYMESLTVEENEYNVFIIGQACINSDDGEDYIDNCIFGISKSGLISWNDDFGDIELEYIDDIVVLEL